MSIDALLDRLTPLTGGAELDLDVLAAVAARVRSRQALFARTGAVHAASAFTRDGELVVVREDVGRHNAVDKVVGRLLLDGRLPAADLCLARFVRDERMTIYAPTPMMRPAAGGGLGALA